MEQGRLGVDAAAVAAWDALRARAEAAWVAHSPQGRGGIVCVQNAVKKCRMLLENLVVIKLVLHVGQEWQKNSISDLKGA